MIKILFACFISLAISINCFSQVVFEEHDIPTTVDYPVWVFAIDIDGDNDIDVLSASDTDDQIAWYENDGNQNFTQHTISIGVNGATSVFAVDIDNDSDIDVLSSSNNDGKIFWHKNDGNQNFTDTIISSYPWGAAEVLAIDIDNDNDSDIIVPGRHVDKVMLYKNNGNLTFTEDTVSSNVDEPCSVFAIDMDGDTDIDVLSASSMDNKISWFENNGSLSFTEHIISVNSVWAMDVFAMDFDGDSDIDVLSGSYNDEKLSWYENDGSQSFTEHIITQWTHGVYALTALDIDNDSDNDIIACIYYNVIWFKNNGNMTFTKDTLNHNIISDPRSLFTIDLDGDSDIDVLTVDANNNRIIWYEQCQNTSSTLNLTVCDSYTSPSGNYTWTTSDTYTDIIPNSIGCDSIITINLTVNHSVAIQNQPIDKNICQGNTVTFSASYSGTSPSFQWMKNGYEITGETSSDYTIPSVSITDEGIYSYTISNMCDSLTSGQSELKVIELNIDAGIDDNICLGNSTQLHVNVGSNHSSESGVFNFSWNPLNGLNNPNIENPVASPNITSTYIVTSTDQIGCSISDSVSIFVQAVFQNQQLCLVTVDTATQKNKIMWEGTTNVGTESYLIQKAVTSNVYSAIGSVNATDPHIFIDYASNPSSHSDFYKIQVIDTCGNISEIDSCAYHKTINLTLSNVGSTMSLNWEEYVVEDGSYIPASYYIYRGTSPDSLMPYDTVIGMVHTYNDLNITKVFHYMVGVKRDDCNGSKTNYISFSNKKDNSDLIDDGIYENGGYSPAIIYPNPASNNLYIEFNNPYGNIYFLQINDITGKTLFKTNTCQSKYILDISEFTAGVYFVEIIGNNIYKGKFIVK